MSEFPADPSDRQRRPLPDIQPARTSLPSSSSLGSGATSSKARSSSSSSLSGGGHLPPAGPSPAGLGPGPGYAASVPLPPRTQLTRVACETCRRRRTKCSGDRPKCAACVRTRSECTYQSLSSAETNSQALKRRLEEVEDEKNVFKELYKYLSTGTENRAYDIVRRIRMGADVATIVRQIQDGDLLLQVSLVPETRLRFDFPYRTQMPAAIQRSGNAYLGSVMYEAIHAEDRQQSEAGDEQQQQQRQQDELEDLAKRYPPQYLRPYHAAKLVDPRLGLVDVTRWTQVTPDNELFVSILSAYLLQEYPGFPVFHKDTFLQALVDGDRRFCSPLLVNALMAEACHCYYGVPNRPRYWDPHTLGYRFLAEAKRLWEFQAESVSLVRVQAATLLHLAYAHNGLDLLGLPFLASAVEIGRKLGIFDSMESVDAEESGLADARLFTAWTVFQHATIAGFHYQRPGLMDSPPQAPLPQPDERPKLYGDLDLQYPLHEGLISTDYGHLFRAASMLRVILNDIAALAFSKGSRGLPADRWLDFRDQLKAWYLGLPVSLLPKNIIWPAQFAMHMEYHIALITLSRMRISEDSIDGPTASNSLVSSARRAAAEILPLAIINLETVIRLHYVRHSFEYYEGHLTGFLTNMCNIAMESRVAGSADTLESDSREHMRSTLVLCLRGLAHQGKHVHIAGVICKLLLERQMPEDLNLLGAHIGPDMLDDRSMLGQRVYSAYPLESGNMKDADSSRLEKILREHNSEVQ